MGARQPNESAGSQTSDKEFTTCGNSFLPDPRHLEIGVAKENPMQSQQALRAAKHYFAMTTCGSDCNATEAAALARVDSLAKSASVILEHWWPDRRRSWGPAWTGSILEILFVAQTHFSSCHWPSYAAAQDGLRQAITEQLHKQDQDSLLMLVNNMPPIRSSMAACQPHNIGQSQINPLWPCQLRQRKIESERSCSGRSNN